MRLRTGFTLVELIIVLVVLAVLVAATMGFLRQRREAEERAIEAGTPGDLAGTVTYLGNPVPGARVWAQSYSRERGPRRDLGGSGSMLTATDGAFSFAAIRPREAALVVRIEAGALPGAPSDPARMIFFRTRSRPERTVVHELSIPRVEAGVAFPRTLPHNEELYGAAVWSIHGPGNWERFEAVPAPIEMESEFLYLARVPAGKIHAEFRVKGVGYSGSRYYDTEAVKGETLELPSGFSAGSELTFKVVGLPRSDQYLNVGFQLFPVDLAPESPDDLSLSDIPLRLTIDIHARLFSDEFKLAGVPPGEYVAYAILRTQTERPSEPARVTIQPDTPATVQLTISWAADP